MSLIESLFRIIFTLLFFCLASYFYLYGKEIEKEKKRAYLLTPPRTETIMKTAMIISLVAALFSLLGLLDPTAFVF